MQQQLLAFTGMFLTFVCFIEGLGNGFLIERKVNNKELLIISSHVPGTVSTYSALVGAAFVLCAIFLTMVYFLVAELSENENDDYEVLKVLQYYQLNDYKT